jgi:hypothetical protein
VSKLNQIDPGDDGKTVFTDADVEPQILQIIRNAESQVTFVTPYVELWNHLKDEILEARRRNVQVLFFIRVGGRVKDPTDLPWLRSNISALYEVPMLHAKIYLNEKTVLVSSMNITMGSTRNSMDFAMLVRRQGDAQELRDYVNRLPAKSTSRQPLSIGGYVSGYVSGLVKTAAAQSFPHLGRENAQGYCIRGDEIIPLNPKHPFCDSHYQLWAAWKKDDYPEKYCHSCGKRAKTTARNPQCTDCYQLVHTS